MPLRKILFISILAASATVQAQVQHQFGVNASQFVKQFISPNNTVVNNTNPYLVTYRMHRKQINYRAGAGGTYSFLNEDNGASKFQQNTDAHSYNLRAGIDFTKQVTKRWFLYYGLDVTTFRSKTKITTTPGQGTFINKTIITRTGKSNGFSGCFTVEYRLNDKITLFAEANLNFTRSRTYEKVENPDFPNSSSENKTRAGDFSFSSPLSIFFSIII